MLLDFETRNEIAKVNETLGIVFGYLIVCKVDGEDYFDRQGDHIPEDAMLKAATDFMENSRVVKEMHQGEALPGSVVFCFPLTEETTKAFGIECEKTGLIIGMKPDNDATLQKFIDGTYTGFSIGGIRIRDEVV